MYKSTLHFLLLLFILGSCMTTPENPTDEITNNKISENSTGSIIQDNWHISRSSIGLSSWNIYLKNELIGTSRNMGNSYTAYNPQNWIAITDQNCTGEGIPSDFQGSNCVLSWSEGGSGVIGFCATRYYNSGSLEGQIVDTTLIIHRGFVESPFISEGEKEAVYVHEIGHCLGLKHPPAIEANKTRIMYPQVVSGTTRPNSGELTAIQDAYNPIQSPSNANRDEYFSVTSGNIAIRHFSFPTFYIAPSRLSPFDSRSFMPPGPPLKGPVKTVIHKFYYQSSSINFESSLHCKNEIIK